MADISVTNQVDVIASLQVNDGAPLAAASLKTLQFSGANVAEDLPKPMDQFPLDEVELGLGLNAPAALVGDGFKYHFGGGESATYSVYSSKKKKLFTDEFSPAIAIGQGECWGGLSINFTLKESVGTPATGFGITVGATQGIAVGTYLKFPTTGTTVPAFKDGLATLIEHYSIPVTAAQIRATPVGLVHTAEATGTISLGASYTTPLTLNPLATLGLPFNMTLKFGPNVQAVVKGTVTLSGAFIVRAYRSAATKLVFGVYKKRATELKASLTDSAGLGADINKTDVLAQLLNAVVPSADLSGLQLDDEQKNDLRAGLKECVDESLAIAMNASCTATDADEAAVVYELDISCADLRATDAAIERALLGDWSQFEGLANATCVRHIGKVSQERNHRLNFNLLGLYNATSVSDYLKSCTVLHDEHGQITITDKATAKSLSAGTTPYAAKSEKLRAALAQAFVATATYGVTKGKLGMTGFTIQQSMLEYHAQATAGNLGAQVTLGRSVKLPLNSEWDAILKYNGLFSQDKFYLNIAYDERSIMRLFYQDADTRKPYAAEFVDQIGRQTRIALLDPMGPNSMQRRMALSNDAIWNAMTESGNTANFRMIPGLAKLAAPALADICSDFLDIRWWSDAVQSIAPKLTAVLFAIEQSKTPNALDDGAFMTAHKALENALSRLTSKTHSAFGDGWPLAVMYRLATSTPGSGPLVQMDIGWNGKFEHYETGGGMAVGKTSGN